MSNGSSTPSPEPAAPAAPAAPPPRKRSRIKRFLLLWLAGVLVALAIWTVAALNFTYSDGDRGGVLQKLSRKGWLCKTYEGELALYVVPGMAPEIWEFSVRDEAVAKQLSGFVGERIQLHYAEHRGIPTNCFGETSYFVDRVTPAPSPTPPVLPDASAPPTPPTPPTPPATPSPP